MLHFNSMNEASEIFKALSAPMRLRIMELIYEDDNKSLNDIANILKLTNSAISLHIKKLEEVGLIENYDYVVVNEDIEDTASAIDKIVESEKSKVKHNLNTVNKILKGE